MPTAMNPGGAERHTTSSTSGIAASSARLSGAPTGIASTTDAAPSSRATRLATRAVAPVATPSSTITAVRPVRSTGGRSTAEPAHARLELRAFPLLDGREARCGDAAVAKHVIVQHARPALADGAHRDLGLPGETELAHDEHVERRVERRRDLRRDGHAAPRQAEHDGALDRAPRERLREPAARVASIAEVVHLPWCGSGDPSSQSPSTSAARSGSLSRSGTSISTARDCSIRPR